MKGLGDLVEWITVHTGIKWLVKKIWGEDCGCDQRKDYLNEKVSFDKPSTLESKNKPVPTPPLQ